MGGGEGGRGGDGGWGGRAGSGGGPGGDGGEGGAGGGDGSGGGGLVSFSVSTMAMSIKNPDPTVAPMPRTRTSALETTPKRMRTGSWSSTSPTTAPVGSLFGANRTGVAAKRGAIALWSTLRRVGILLCARVVSQWRLAESSRRSLRERTNRVGCNPKIATRTRASIRRLVRRLLSTSIRATPGYPRYPRTP